MVSALRSTSSSLKWPFVLTCAGVATSSWLAASWLAALALSFGNAIENANKKQDTTPDWRRWILKRDSLLATFAIVTANIALTPDTHRKVAKLGE
ncbi:MAG: hypothetical protein AAGK37_10935 [Pseudomonadota bacterium]